MLILSSSICGEEILDSGSDSPEPIVTSESIELPILMYHFLVENRGELHICPSEFELDLQFLKANGYNTIGITDLLDFVYSNKPLPENPIMLTFDDGYYNNYKHGFTLLQQYKQKAVIFIIGEHIDLWSDDFYEDIEVGHMTWEHIRKMLDSGLVEFGSHTHNLHKLESDCGRRGASRNNGECLSEFRTIFEDDANKFVTRMIEETGITPVSFAFPFHAVCEYAVQILKELRYRVIFTYRGNNAINLITPYQPETLFNLYRINRCSLRSAESILQDIRLS